MNGLKTTYRIGLLVILTTLGWSTDAQSVSVAEPADVQHQDTMLSRIYVEQSATALTKKDWTTAGALLRIALEFDSRNSDALYLRGRMYEEMGGSIPQAISAFRAALSFAEWTLYLPSECKLKLAPLLIRTKQYDGALTVLQGMGTATADYLYNVAEALMGAGDRYRARNLLEQAVSAFPTDRRFMVLRIRIDPNYRRNLAAQYLAGVNSVSPAQGVLAALIRDTQDSVEKGHLISLYNRSFPPSPAVFAQSLLALSHVTAVEIDRFVADGLLSNGSLTEELYRHLPAGPAKNRLAQKVADYSGTVGLDTNGDGFDEESADYSAGKLTRLVVDSDQDGVPEYRIDFSNGLPSSVALVKGGTTYRLTYAGYPFLSSATFDLNGERVNYTLEPGRVAFPLFGARRSLPGGPEAFPPLVDPIASLSRQALFAFATQVATTSSSTNQPVSLWKKSIGDLLLLEKQWQGGRYTYKAVYRHGQEISAEIDLNNDGYYEVHERYRDGKLWKVTYDGDHDGIPEFTLVLQPYPTLSWDFNGDGIADEIEKRVSPNTTILEFSTKMNGVFDVVTREVRK